MRGWSAPHAAGGPPLVDPTVAEVEVERLTIGEDVRLDEDPDAIGELAYSISELGVLQPLIVRRTAGGVEVVAGRRRLAAARMAGLDTVPCIFRDLTDNEAFDSALAENLHRRSLSWIEVALAYDKLRSRGLQQREIATLVGKHESHVSAVLQLLTIPRDLQQRVHRREISYSTALDLARRGQSKGRAGGAPSKRLSDAALAAEDAAIATHWRRRHDRLIAGIVQVIKANDADGVKVRQMLDRLLKLDRQPLEGAA